MMKAVLFTHIVPCSANGANVYIARVMRTLLKLGFDLQLNSVATCPSNRQATREWVPELQVAGVRHRTRYASTKVAPFIVALFRLVAASVKDLRQADVVLFRLFWFQPVALLAKLVKPGVRVIWLHDGIVEEISYRHQGRLHVYLAKFAGWIERFFSRWVDMHLPVSHRMLEYGKQQGVRPLRGHLVLPCVVETDRFRPAGRMFRPGEPIVIGFAGSIARWHAFEEACRYLKYLSEQGNPISFHVLTPAVEKAREILSSVGLAAVVESVSHTQVPERMRTWHFAVSPQRAGLVTRVCSPLKVGEALAMGLPVLISPAVGDYSDLILSHGAGMAFDPESPSSWGDTLPRFRALLSSYEQACSNARRLAEENFGMNQLEIVLENAVGTRTR